MCGIVGILGREPVAPLMVDALKRLEYRGYDSAGVATLEQGHLERRRAEGKLKNLERRLDREPLSGTIGIGHTRWATHGGPNESNAHPHATDRVAVVHNGIIENFNELREALTADGAKFTSETDTEVVAHLVTHEMQQGPHAGRGGRGRAAAAQGRVRARLPVRGRGGPAGRRPPRLAARDRLRQGRDVSRLRRDRARAVHRRDQLSRRRRLGGGEPRGRRGARRGRPRGDARGAEIGRLGVPGRQGQLSPLHGEGDPRAARGGRAHARPLHRPRRASGSRCRPGCRSTSRRSGA